MSNVLPLWFNRSSQFLNTYKTTPFVNKRAYYYYKFFLRQPCLKANWNLKKSQKPCWRTEFTTQWLKTFSCRSHDSRFALRRLTVYCSPRFALSGLLSSKFTNVKSCFFFFLFFFFSTFFNFFRFLFVYKNSYNWQIQKKRIHLFQAQFNEIILGFIDNMVDFKAAERASCLKFVNLLKIDDWDENASVLNNNKSQKSLWNSRKYRKNDSTVKFWSLTWRMTSRK